MKRSERRSSNCDINSISPPSVQFAMGTPPMGSRRRSTSGGSETPPPPCTWQVSPASHQSPLRRSDTNSPLLSTALSRLPTISSPTNENNNPLSGRLGRTLVMPDIGQNNQFQSFLQDAAGNSDHITFRAPELPAETLMDVSISMKILWKSLLI